jgi:hypothetical protein
VLRRSCALLVAGAEGRELPRGGRGPVRSPHTVALERSLEELGREAFQSLVLRTLLLAEAADHPRSMRHAMRNPYAKREAAAPGGK